MTARTAAAGHRRTGPVPRTSALLVIDMQQALVAIAHRPAETVAVIAGLRRRAAAAGAPVVTVQHRGGGLAEGSHGWRIVPELAPGAGEPVVHKTSADGFLGTGLDRTLKAAGVTEVVVTGFATEICVDTTARQALSHGYDVVLVADGHTTSVRPDAGEYAAPERSVAHHNEIFRNLDFPGRSIRVLPASAVDFAPADLPAADPFADADAAEAGAPEAEAAPESR
ncbi:isochorismatase [Kitasatospora sp. NE20-6]|uniref:isochorismatase family protein n=1 Tax=Kitasatospora sp. NE20-6 TaxID=2859066 RepID=UPI0034DBE313